jgi:hypothetical protein
MATERQIQANRRNSALSTGPTSEAGKARSRSNATKHGMAGESADVEAGLSNEFQERRDRWAAEHQPVGDAGNYALDRVVAASLRIERCERTIDDLTSTCRERARLAWDQDRDIEAATIFGRLARDPVLASRQLQATLSGVILLIEAWFRLIAALETGKDWTESEASRALDLLGVAADLRNGRTPIDDPEGGYVVAFRQALALEQVERLEALRDQGLIPLDELQRRQALAGDIAILSKEAKLVLRYEREAWKRYNESMKELKAQVEVVATPTRPTMPPSRADSVPPPRVVADSPPAMLPVDMDAWLDRLEARLDGLDSQPGSFVPIAVGARPAMPERSQSGDRRSRKKLSRMASR